MIKQKLLMHMLCAFSSKEHLKSIIDKHNLIEEKTVDTFGICSWIVHEKIYYSEVSSNYIKLLKELGFQREKGMNNILFYKTFEARQKAIVIAYTNESLRYIKEIYNISHLSNKDILQIQLEILEHLEMIFFSKHTLEYHLEQVDRDNPKGICTVIEDLQPKLFHYLNKEIDIRFLNLEKYCTDDSYKVDYNYWFSTREERLNAIQSEIKIIRLCLTIL